MKTPLSSFSVKLNSKLLTFAALIISLYLTKTDAQSYATWTTGANKLIYPGRQLAIGYNNISDTIYILGGWNRYCFDANNYQILSQLTSFKDGIFTDLGANYFPSG